MDINLGASPLIENPNQVHHDNTLYGKGTKESPLKVRSSALTDGNGIYDGSGDVPPGTIATVQADLSFVGAGPDTSFYTEMADGSDLTFIELSPTNVNIGYDGLTTSTIEFSSSGINLMNARAINLNPVPENTASSGLLVTFTANENQGFGDAIRIASDGDAAIADASVVATSYAIGLCVTTVTAGNTGTYLLQGFARDDTWNWTVGGPIYLSLNGTTGNTLTQTAPSATNEVVQILGIATHADRIYFNPQLVQVEHV